MQTNLTQLKEQKDTFQKSADYLRETLRGAEKGLEEVRKELEQVQAELKAEQKEKETLKESHQQELKQRSEAYGVVQERNKELSNKLQNSQIEVSKLSEWIGKLEAVSGDSNAFERLKKELEDLELKKELKDRETNAAAK